MGLSIIFYFVYKKFYQLNETNALSTHVYILAGRYISEMSGNNMPILNHVSCPTLNP